MSPPMLHPQVALMSTRRHASIFAGLLIAMLVAGVQPSSAAKAVTVWNAAPTTAQTFSTHPMTSGTMVTVNDRQMVIDTDQGERVTLELDSRTMAPRDLAPGMTMRTKFLATLTTEPEPPAAVAHPVFTGSHAAPAAERPTLQQTESPWPLLLFLSLVALGAAGLGTVVRELRTT